MAANACSAWDNSRCEGSDHCPPRCPRFVDDEGTPVVIRPYGPDRRDALLATDRPFSPAGQSIADGYELAPTDRVRRPLRRQSGTSDSGGRDPREN